jgi:hypothetical protein
VPHTEPSARTDARPCTCDFCINFAPAESASCNFGFRELIRFLCASCGLQSLVGSSIRNRPRLVQCLRKILAEDKRRREEEAKCNGFSYSLWHLAVATGVAFPRTFCYQPPPEIVRSQFIILNPGKRMCYYLHMFLRSESSKRPVATHEHVVKCILQRDIRHTDLLHDVRIAVHP